MCRADRTRRADRKSHPCARLICRPVCSDCYRIPTVKVFLFSSSFNPLADVKCFSMNHRVSLGLDLFSCLQVITLWSVLVKCSVYSLVITLVYWVRDIKSVWLYFILLSTYILLNLLSYATILYISYIRLQ